MAGAVSALPKFQFTSAAGVPLANGTLEVYVAGSTTHANTYQDSALTTLNTWPITLDAAGECMMWLDDTKRYKFVLKNAAGAQQWSIDNVPAGAAASTLVSFIQAGTGAVERTVQDKARDAISVFDFFTAAEKADALTGSPATDTTLKIQAAIDAALLAGQRVEAYGTFRIGAAKLVIKGDTDFSQATFKVYGAPAIAVEVSSGNAADPTTSLVNVVVWLPKRIENTTKPATGWAAQGIGVRAVNCQSCRIYIGNNVGFAVGFRPTSFGLGNVYNEYHVGFLENNQINLDLLPGDAAGWVNENNFYGGRYSHESAEGAGVVGTRHIRMSKATNVVNNNLFIKPSIEGNVAEYHVENGGSFNRIINGRWEATTPKVLYTGDTTSQGIRNTIDGGYNTQNIVYTFTGLGGNSNRASFAGGSIENVNGVGQLFQQETSSANPVHTFYEAGTKPEAAAAGDWSVKSGAQALLGKRKADGFERVKLDYVNGRVYLNNGVAASSCYFGYSGGSLLFTGWLDVSPGVTATTDLGEATLRYKRLYLSQGVGFHGATPPTSQPSVTGSRGANAALASLLTALAACGIIADNTTA